MRRIASLAAAATLAVSPVLASPAAPVLTVDKTVGKVGGWSIGESATIGGCVAAATFQDQTTIWFGFSGDQNRAFLALTNPRWRSLESGQTYQILIRAGDQGKWRGNFVGFDRNGDKGLFSSGLKERFVADLSDAGQLQVEFEGRQITTASLAGSTEALQAVMGCHKAFGTTQAKARDTSPKSADNRKEDRESSQGTGFYVSSKGHVLTNNHVIDGCRDVLITRSGMSAIPAHVIAKDALNDLALISTDLPQAVVPPLAPRARIGEAVYAYGFPLNGLLATTGNFTIGNVTATAGLGDDTRHIQISAPVQPGNSGGPLVDQYGNVVGVIVSKLNALKMASVTSDLAQNVNFAIKSVIAQNFLDANGIETSARARTTDAMDGATIAEKAKEFTVRINCR